MESTPSQSEQEFKNRSTRELANLSARFAAGEAEIAASYFRWDKRSREKEIHWLEKQAGRELESTFTMMREVMERVGRDLGKQGSFWVDTIPEGLDRHWMEEMLGKIKQELNHGNYCVDILEWLTGERVDIKEVVRRYNRWNPDPTLPNNEEWCKLAKVFRDQEQRKERWAWIITSQGLLEGGSCGLFYAASKLSGDELNQRIARAFQVVLNDERGHGPANVLEITKVINNEEELSGAKEMLIRRGTQRLRMRNEQFSHPLTEQRINDIAAGKIELGVTKEIWGESLYHYLNAA
jgi:hypothetical protein